MSIILIFLNFFVFSLQAQQVITVTAEKVARPLDQTTSTVTVITEEEIINSQKTDLNEIIAEKSGVFLNSNGAAGKTSSLFLRGADSSFTLVVIDGVEYSDRSSVGGAPLYEYLALNNIKKIEILKGSQSVLYGSDALAGVVKITTKDAGQEDGALTFSYGSFDDKSLGVNRQGKGKHFDYSLGLFLREMEGISAFSEDRTTMAEKDGYSNLTGQMKLSRDFSGHAVQFNLLGIKASSEFDNASADLTENNARDDQYLASLIYAHDFSDLFMPQFRFSQNYSDRLNTTYNSFSSKTDVTQLIAKTNKFEVQNTSMFERLTLLSGVEYEEVKASISSLDNRKNHKSYAAYLNAQKDWSFLNIQTGLRATEERDYDTQIVWKVGVVKPLPWGIRFKSNAGTGFKSPSLYQLFSSFGDENLRPTESRSFDFSLSKNFSGHQVELVYFLNTYDNFIDYDSSVSKYANTFKSRTSGFELAVDGSMGSFRYGANATLLKAINLSEGKVGQYLARRPREKYSIFIEKNYEQYLFGVDGRYVGRRENSDFDDIVLSSYFTMDLRVGYDLSQDDSLMLKIGNLMDHDYEQVSGYGTPGRTWQFKWRTKI